MTKQKSLGDPSFDFYTIRKDLTSTFHGLPEVLATNPNQDLAHLTLRLGKFMVWHSGKIDGHSSRINSVLPIKIPTVYDVGFRLREASIASLEGKNIAVCHQSYTQGVLELHNRMERLEQVLMAGGGK